jgi:kynureninase
VNYAQLIRLDQQDPLANKREEFSLPVDTIYLDGNSLGALPKAAASRVEAVVKAQWGKDLIKSWNTHQWIDLPINIGEQIAPLIGAGSGQVICCDSTSINLFKVLSSAMQLQAGRKIVLSQRNNFPTDLYMVEGLGALLGAQRLELQLVDEQQIEGALTDEVAVLMLTQVDFRSGKLLDMQKITQLAHAQGVLVIWDLAHSAGALPIELDDWAVDFAVGCGYKYLNGGPGAPAFLYVAQRHHASVTQPLTGWMGHSSPFTFATGYQPGKGVTQYLSGTPAILSMSSLHGALEVFEGVDMQLLRNKSIALSELFINLLEQQPSLADLILLSPKDPQHRGSQLAFTHPDAHAICQALIEQGVIADFRAPDVLRFGFAPLYLRYIDIGRTIDILQQVVESGVYRQLHFRDKLKVT